MNSLEYIPQWFILLYVFCIGLCVGSFLNVVILRGLAGEDIVFSRSKCPKCKNKLKWYMNIPLISYIFLRGKCAYCKSPISIQYPVVEFITASLWLFTYFSFGFTLKTLFLSVIISLFVVLAATDFLETVILLPHAYILTALGIIYSLLNLSGISLVESILTGIFGFIVFEIISRIGKIIAGLRVFGEGDSYIVLSIGTIFGAKALCIVIALSLLIQCAFSLPMIIIASFKEKKHKLAFSYLAVLFSILFIMIINLTDCLSENVHPYISIAICIVMLYCLTNIIGEIKEKKKLINKELDENIDEDFEEAKNIFTLMPFGPALIIASIICIYYLNEIKSLIKHFLF